MKHEVNGVAGPSELETHLFLDGEPDELPEEVCAEFVHCEEILPTVETVEAQGWMRHEFLLIVEVVTEGPVAEAICAIVALLLDIVETDVDLDVIVNGESVIVANVDDLPRGIVCIDSGCHDHWELLLYKEGLSCRYLLEREKDNSK